MTDDLILQAREMQKRMIATTLPGEAGLLYLRDFKRLEKGKSKTGPLKHKGYFRPCSYLFPTV